MTETVLIARGWRWGWCWENCAGRVLYPPRHVEAEVTCTSEYNPHTATVRPANERRTT